MSNSQQEDGGQERQRPNHYQHPTTAPENIFTNIYNVIAGARETASQEFTRFWESLGHAQRPYYYYPSSSSSTAIQGRKIKTPTSLRGKQFISRSSSSSINGRFLPDDNVRGSVKDVEIQTDDDLLQPTSLSIPSKRSASSTFEEYHIPFPVKRFSEKTSLSTAERDASFERPAFLSRGMDTTSNQDVSGQPQKESSEQEKPEEHPEQEQPQEQPEQEQPKEQKVASVSNKDKEALPTPPPPPPPPAPLAPALSSLSPKRVPIRKAMSLSPNRPSSTSTSWGALSVGRYTPSPNRDIRTGSKSVRRLTMELESQFSPKFPSPHPPKRQRRESIQEASVSASPQNDRQGEPSLSPASHYRSELAATLATQAQAASSSMTSHTLPMKALQPKAPEAEEQQQQQQHSATNKDEDDYYTNLLKQKELDERVNKLEKKVSIARTRVSEFSAENSGGSNSSSDGLITSPTPSHTLQSSPSRPSIPTAPATPSAHPYKSPVRDTRESTSPYRLSNTLVSSLQQSTKEASFSPPSVSYATAKAAIQEAVNRKGSASPFGERTSSVRFSMSRPLTPVPPPPAPPQPLQSAASLFSSSSSSPSGVFSSSKEASSTYYPPKHTPSPYLQQPSKGITQLKPNDQHKSKMKEVIKMIPHFNLRRADTIIGPDGVSRPNPIWLDIYDPNRRRLYGQGL